MNSMAYRATCFVLKMAIAALLAFAAAWGVAMLTGCGHKQMRPAHPSAQLSIPVNCIDQVHGTSQTVCEATDPVHPDIAVCGPLQVHFTCTKVIPKKTLGGIMELFVFALMFAASSLSIGKVIALVLVAFLIGLVIGAQVTSHEERVLNYNLEDVELDELHKIEAAATAEGKAVIAKLKAAANFVWRRR